MNQKAETRAGTASEKTEKNIRRAGIPHLVREEVSRKSLSYAVTAIVAIFFGFLAIPIFSTAVIPLEESARSGGRLIDFFFVAILAILSINTFSRSYLMIHRDPFHGWLVFLRSLPVSPKEMVFARSLIMLPATLVMTTLFFAPLVVFSGFLEPRFDAGQYLCFASIWLGYALAAGGINLLLELGVSGKFAFVFQFVWLAAIAAAVWLTGGNLVYSTFRLAGEYDPLAAGVSLFIGGIFFAVLARATERRVAEREFAI